MFGNLSNYRYLFEFNYYYTEKENTYDKIDAYEKVEINDKIEDTMLYSTVYDSSSYDDFRIYSTYKKEYVLSDYDNLTLDILNKVSKNEDMIYFLLPISSVLVIIFMTYLVISIGHTKGKDEIDTNDLDKIPFEILLTIAIIIITIGLAVVYSFGNARMQEYYKLMLSGIITAYFAVYTSVAITLTTFIRRVKAKTLMETTIVGKIIKFFKRVINGWTNLFRGSKKLTMKLIIYIFSYITIMLIILAVFNSRFMGIFIDILITIYILYKIAQKIKSFETIEEHLKEIYEGNINEPLDIESVAPEFKETVQYINDISNGFENAIQKEIQSERLKTELITNVSHDIKTPLTSIINYVDLLKREDIKNDKAKEYIEILEAKSHRLKRLTEDLVEASKASSGNVKLNLEKINIGELINQTTGEFEDRFRENGIEVIAKLPEKDAFIEADSRYMYRVIENLFSNIAKYAAKSSRVYIDIVTNSDKVRVSIKNISAEKLNISPEELMQRFVRGDRSRTTEGSGLGLSISRDLTELQKGKFSIQIDGDLFKVDLEFEMI